MIFLNDDPLFGFQQIRDSSIKLKLFLSSSDTFRSFSEFFNISFAFCNVTLAYFNLKKISKVQEDDDDFTF